MRQRTDALPTDADSAAQLRPAATAPDLPVSRFPEFFFLLTVLAITAIRIAEAHTDFVRHPGSDWSSSDWMINFSAGFVRRGLGGAAISLLMRLTGLGFFPVWITLTASVFVLLCAYLVRISWHLRGPAVWRFALLFNPLLLLSCCVSGMFLRKDMLAVLATLLNVLLGHQVLRRDTASTSARAALALLPLSAAAGSALILALLHEGVFLFIWLPLNLLLLAWVLARLRFNRPAVALLLAIAFAPALFAVAAEALRHGNAQTAQTICQSWRGSFPIDCTSGPGFPPAFDALSWSLSRGIAIALQYAWTFPIALAIYALAAGVILIAIRALIPAAQLKHLIVLLVLPLPASLPLFLLGMDWGRWLSLLAITALMPMLSSRLRPALHDCLPATLRRLVNDSIAPPVARALAALRRIIERHPIRSCAAMFCLPVPPLPLWWAVFVLNPPVIVLRFLFHFWIK